MGGGSNKKYTSSKSSNQSSNTTKKTEKFSDKSKKLSVVITDPNNTSPLKKMKSITVQSVAKVLNVKISVANSYVKNLESKGQIELVGGYSGHRIYKLK
ncbi:MAG: hypothetical protein ACPKPY_10100 [Nitrososphaeraceae archaeon]